MPDRGPLPPLIVRLFRRARPRALRQLRATRWPALGVPLLAALMVCGGEVSGLTRLTKPALEGAGILVIVSGALVAWLALTVTRSGWSLWVALLLSCLAAREVHFAGTDGGVYLGLLALLGAAWAAYPRLRAHLCAPGASTLLVGGFGCYLIAQASDQRALRWVPGERVFHVGLEEALEVLGHALLSLLVFAPPLRSRARGPWLGERLRAGLTGPRLALVGGALLLLVAAGEVLARAVTPQAVAERVLGARVPVASTPVRAEGAAARGDGPAAGPLLVLGDPWLPEGDDPRPVDVRAELARATQGISLHDQAVLLVGVRELAIAACGAERAHGERSWAWRLRRRSALYRAARRLPDGLFYWLSDDTCQARRRDRGVARRLPAYRRGGDPAPWVAALSARLGAARTAAGARQLLVVLVPDPIQVDDRYPAAVLVRYREAPDAYDLAGPRGALLERLRRVGLEVIDPLPALRALAPRQDWPTTEALPAGAARWVAAAVAEQLATPAR